jgi:hypothetical protein
MYQSPNIAIESTGSRLTIDDEVLESCLTARLWISEPRRLLKNVTLLLCALYNFGIAVTRTGCAALLNAERSSVHSFAMQISDRLSEMTT